MDNQVNQASLEKSNYEVVNIKQGNFYDFSEIQTKKRNSEKVKYQFFPEKEIDGDKKLVNEKNHHSQITEFKSIFDKKFFEFEEKYNKEYKRMSNDILNSSRAIQKLFENYNLLVEKSNILNISLTELKKNFIDESLLSIVGKLDMPKMNEDESSIKKLEQRLNDKIELLEKKNFNFKNEIIDEYLPSIVKKLNMPTINEYEGLEIQIFNLKNQMKELQEEGQLIKSQFSNKTTHILPQIEKEKIISKKMENKIKIFNRELSQLQSKMNKTSEISKTDKIHSIINNEREKILFRKIENKIKVLSGEQTLVKSYLNHMHIKMSFDEYSNILINLQSKKEDKTLNKFFESNYQKFILTDEKLIKSYTYYINLFSIFSDLRNVTLNFSTLFIGNKEIILISDFFQNLKSLTILNLDLSKNEFTNVGVEHLSKNLGSLKKLKEIDLRLSDNKLNDNFCNFIGKCLNENLEKLHLQLNYINLGGSSLNQLRNEISKMKCLNDLLLSFAGSTIGDEKISEVGEIVKNQTKLNSLTILISNNKLKEKGFSNLIKLLEWSTKITNLSLNFGLNDFSKTNVKELSSYLEKLSKRITHLNLKLENCKLVDDDIKLICSTIEKFQGIKQVILNLDRNNITCEGANIFSSYFEAKK